jgi:hypothetical protein
MAVHRRSRLDLVTVLAQAAEQRRTSLNQAVTQVGRQLGVHPDTLHIWTTILDRPPAGGHRAPLPLLGLLAHTCQTRLVPGRDHRGGPAYLCPCPTRPVIPAHVAHLHILAALGAKVRPLVSQHGLTVLATVLTTIRLDDTGTATATTWRPPPQTRPGHPAAPPTVAATLGGPR